MPQINLIRLTRLVITVLPVLLLSFNSSSAQAIIDLRSQDLSSNIIELKGPWEVFPFVLLEPGENIKPDDVLYLPHHWKLGGGPIGFVSYRTQVILPGNLSQQEMALSMPDVYSCFAVIINGTLSGSNGTVGTSKSNEEPQWLPKVIHFSTLKDTVEIIIHVSNFHHSKGGVDKPIRIATAQLMDTTSKEIFLSEAFLFLILVAIALASFLITSKVKSKALPFYFGLVCISWALRTVFSNNYLAVQFFNDLNWNLVVKIEYISIYASTLFALLFVRALFPDDFNKRLHVFYIVASIVFTFFTLLTPPLIFTRFVSVYLAFSAFLIISVLFVTLKAFVFDRRGVNTMMLAIFFLAGVFAYVILSYYRFVPFNIYIFILGFLMIFTLCAIALWGRLKGEVYFTKEDKI